jgi:ATP-binding cassette, subfamily B, multidrug efflux pump
MLNLIKHLKPFSWQIAIIFCLLFGQAMTDLTLPDYMSRIINVGVQQNGIENPAPDVVRSAEMFKLQILMSDHDRAIVNLHYRLLDKSDLPSEEYANLVKQYPVLSSEPLYVLKTEARPSIPELNNIFGKPEMIVYMVEKNGIGAMIGGGVPALPAGMDPFQYFSQLPAAQQASIRDMMLQRLSAIPERSVRQTAVSFVYDEYTAIGVDTAKVQISYIARIGGLMLLLALLGVVASITVGLISARIAAAFARNTRQRVFKKVENFSNAEFDKFSTASLITRSTNDITQLQMVLIMLLRVVFYAPIIGVGGIIKALGENVNMSWIIAAAVVAQLLLIVTVFTIAVPKFKIMQKLVDRLNLVTREILTGLMVVRAFNTQSWELSKFDKANTDLNNTNLFINKVMVFMMPVMMLIMNGVMLLIIWFGARQIDAGAMQVGNMMAFMQYTVQILMAFMMVSMIFIMLPRAGVSANRISEVLETKLTIVDPIQPLQTGSGVKGSVEFQNVCFKYPGADEYVLKDINFTVKPGQTTAFIGGTGSGKSTLINLILRFYDVTEGRILLDNLDVRDVTQHSLRHKIGYVPQKSTLFSGTVENNIKYGNEAASDSDVEKAAAIAQALEFINSSENGFKAEIAQAGANLSGGQKQRLSIARALAKKPEIYIFDDSFSALDFKTDAELRRALRKETDEATVLIVGQRISTIMNADSIVVLEDGRIAGTGTHQELMETCEVYRELALSQLTKEELA